MPRPIHTPAPKLIATPDLRPFERAELAAVIRRNLCGYPRVKVFLVQDCERPRASRFLAFTGKELAAVLPALPLSALTSAVGYDESGAPAARVSPVFKKGYVFENRQLPVHATICVHEGLYYVKNGETGELPNYLAGLNAVWVRSPRQFGFGFAGFEARAIHH